MKEKYLDTNPENKRRLLRGVYETPIRQFFDGEHSLEVVDDISSSTVVLRVDKGALSGAGDISFEVIRLEDAREIGPEGRKLINAVAGDTVNGKYIKATDEVKFYNLFLYSMNTPNVIRPQGDEGKKQLNEKFDMFLLANYNN